VDQGSVACLVMLDLSAAFDTIDHSILLKRLQNRFGVEGSALSWFHSYLSDRDQAVSIDGVTSEAKVLDFGVPQGSVLGPLVFVDYAAPIGDICCL